MHLCFTWDLAIFSIGFHANLEQAQTFWPFPLQRTRPCLQGSGNHEIRSWNTRLWLLFRKLRKSLEPHSPRRARNPAVLTAHWLPIYRYVKEKALLWKPLMSKKASCCKLPADHLQLLNRSRKSRKTKCPLESFHYREKKGSLGFNAPKSSQLLTSPWLGRCIAKETRANEASGSQYLPEQLW